MWYAGFRKAVKLSPISSGDSLRSMQSCPSDQFVLSPCSALGYITRMDHTWEACRQLVSSPGNSRPSYVAAHRMGRYHVGSWVFATEKAMCAGPAPPCGRWLDYSSMSCGCSTYLAFWFCRFDTDPAEPDNLYDLYAIRDAIRATGTDAVASPHAGGHEMPKIGDPGLLPLADLLRPAPSACLATVRSCLCNCIPDSEKLVREGTKMF